MLSVFINKEVTMAKQWEPVDKYLTKEIRKAMIDADVTFGQIGEGTERAWRYRINNPLRMTNGDYFYLCARLHQDPSELLSRAFKRRDER